MACFYNSISRVTSENNDFECDLFKATLNKAIQKNATEIYSCKPNSLYKKNDK